MKMYDKKELQFKDGYIVAGNEILNVDPRIVKAANQLEFEVQKYGHDKLHEVAALGQEDEGFSRQYENTPKVAISIDTPQLDRKVEESLKLMEELDTQEAVKRVNTKLNYMQQLIEFVVRDYIIAIKADSLYPSRFDLPVLGNPLEWDIEYLVTAVCFGEGLNTDDEEEIIKGILDDKSDEEIMADLGFCFCNNDDEEDEE